MDKFFHVNSGQKRHDNFLDVIIQAKALLRKYLKDKSWLDLYQ